MRIYLVGAHCTGKTTLARYIHKMYGWPMITEVARRVMAEKELSLEKIRTDIEAVDDYQEEVFNRQVATEKEAGPNFVSDRAFDNLAYAADHSMVFRKLVQSDLFKNYVNSVAGGLVFFLRPDKALLSDDGIRERIVWEGIVRIDGMVKMLLEYSGVSYMPISTSSMQERCKIVDYVIRQNQTMVVPLPPNKNGAGLPGNY